MYSRKWKCIIAVTMIKWFLIHEKMEENGVFVYKCNSIREGAGGTGYQPLLFIMARRSRSSLLLFLPCFSVVPTMWLCVMRR